jgi:hypothetical protein
LREHTHRSTDPARPPHRPPSTAILLVPVAVALVLTLFAWPAARQEPRELPLGVAGAPVAAQAVEQRLSAREGAFDVSRYRDEAAARRAIEDRDIYGAFVVTAGGAKVLTASGASQAVAQVLDRAASELRPRAGAVEVQDVVPAPRGAALASSVLPLVLAGILAGAAAAHLGTGSLGRLGLLVAASVLSGLVATAIVQSWLDVVRGDWLANAAALALTVLAIGSVVAGLYALLGAPGAIVGALIMVLIGNPFSGVGSAPELLPQPAGTIGQLMPPGAGGNLLRSTGFFDGAAARGFIAVLVAWTVAGLALLLVAGARARRFATERAGKGSLVA